MREYSYIKSILFTALIFVICFVVLMVDTFFPDIMFPYISIPLMVLSVAVSEIIASYLKLKDDGCIFISAVLGGFSLSLLPLSAGLLGDKPFWIVLVVSIITYGCVDYIYASFEKRMKSGDGAVLAPFVNGFLLFLAFQGFQGIL